MKNKGRRYTEDFFMSVAARRVPTSPPLFVGYDSEEVFFGPSREYMSSFDGRRYCTERGMWAIVYSGWTDLLAEWIGKRKVLEIMAGYGWLARALADAGVDIIATDDASWNDRHEKIDKSLYPIERIDACDAVEKYEREVELLLCSWPPYLDDRILYAADMWQGRDFIYIGEDSGGCNASELFFSMFTTYDEQPVSDIAQWFGMHDRVLVGRIWRDVRTAHEILMEGDEWYAQSHTLDEYS
jgi:hypothetical protein